MLQAGEKFPPELGKSTGSMHDNQQTEGKCPWFKFTQGAVPSQMGPTKRVLGYVLPVHLLPGPPTGVWHPSLDLPGPPSVVLFSPTWGFIPRSKGIACLCTGKFQLLVAPSGFPTAYRSKVLFLFSQHAPCLLLTEPFHPSFTLTTGA